jgi:hypothetical protein
MSVKEIEVVVDNWDRDLKDWEFTILVCKSARKLKAATSKSPQGS